nr:RNA-directed DNA polymerase, eukaryota, reverse transcriptase zinc-binding domain protein [Tanacetum cinerariifolium]
MRNMTGKLKFFKYKIRKWIKDNRGKRKVAFDKLKEELRLVDEAIDKGVGTEDVVNKRVGVLNSLRYIDQMHAMDLAQKAKIKWGIMVDGVWKEQPNDVKKEFLNHFQERFDKPFERRVTIDVSYPRSISGEQRDELEREVTIEEIKTVVWNCGTDKSQGPDGFTFDFYRQFWSTIDKDVFINVLGDIVSEVQSAFVAGRQILGGLFILNEVLHWCSKKKQKSLIFKVDFEKAYDSVRWDFLDDVLKKFDFGNKWVKTKQPSCYLSKNQVSIHMLSETLAVV